jgi:hypothetical protein
MRRQTAADYDGIMSFYWCAVCDAEMARYPHNDFWDGINYGDVKNGNEETWNETRREIEGEST